MGSPWSWILGGLQLLAGIVLTATGVGAGVGIKLLLSGGLTLLSSFMAAPGRGGFQTSPRYGFDNASNVVRDGGAIPVIYGEEVVAPAIVSVNIVQEGEEQRLLMLGLVCEGEIESISEVRLNDTPIEQLQTITNGTITAGPRYATRLGTATQSVIGTATGEERLNFSQIGTPYEINAKLNGANGGQYIHEMKSAADEVVLAFVWPGGAYYMTAEGKVSSINAGVRVSYKQVGAFGPYGGVDISQPGGDWRRGSVSGEYYIVSGTASTVRRQLRVKLPSRGRYLIKVEVGGEDTTRKVFVATLATVVEVLNDSRAYANRALIGIMAPASAQLSGGVPRVTCKVRGRKVYDPRTGTTAWSRNPILCVRDLLLSTRFGLGRWLSSSDLDEGVGGTWRTVANACDADVSSPGTATEDHWQLDIVLDAKAQAREWITQMLSTCRAALFGSQGLIKITQDTTGASARDFSEDEGDGRRKNILATENGRTGPVSSLVERTLEDTQRWTVVRVRHVDRDDSYRQRLLELRQKRAAIGVVTGGPFYAGEALTYVVGTTVMVACRVSRACANGDAHIYFTEEQNGTLPTGATAVTGSTSRATATVTFTSDDNIYPERALEMQLYGVTRKSQALREARYHMNRANLTPILASWGVFLGDLDLEPGDIVSVYSARLGWSGKLFSVLSLSYEGDGTGRIEAREYSAAAFGDVVDVVPTKVTFQPGGAVQSGIRSASGSVETGSGSTSTKGTSQTTIQGTHITIRLR